MLVRSLHTDVRRFLVSVLLSSDVSGDYDELSFELGWLKDIIKGLDIQVLPLPTDEFDKLVELGRANYRTQAIPELSPKDIRLDVRQSVYGDEIPDVVFYDGLFRPGWDHYDVETPHRIAMHG